MKPSVVLFFILVVLSAGATADEQTETGPDPAGYSYFGQRGLFRSWAGVPYDAGSVAFGTWLEFFRSSDFLTEGDENQRTSMRFVLAGTPVTGLEINAGFSFVVNQNTAFAEEQSQNIGDPFLGIRYGLALTDWFSLGAGAQVLLPSGRNYAELSVDGICARFVLHADFAPIPETLVVLNLGYHLDNSSEVFGSGLDQAQLFAAGVNPYDQVLVHLGFAWQLGPVAPFLEYGLALAPTAADLSFGDNPNWLTVGLRAWPLSHHGLQLLVAVDVGLAGVHPPDGAARIPPYNLIFGVGYDFGARPEPEPREVIREKTVFVEKRVEVPAQCPEAPGRKPFGRVIGQVVDASSKAPLGGARIKVTGEETQTLLADLDQGRFATCPQAPGPVKLAVWMEGYQEQTQAVLIQGDSDSQMVVALQPAKGLAFGTIQGIIRAATGQPLDALVLIPARKKRIKADGKTGGFSLEVATGTFDVMISKPGFRAQRRRVKLGASDLVILNVELYPKQ